ncbi:MAG: hypothetical protein V3T83_12680 [Acidobacteriota bacterium]
MANLTIAIDDDLLRRARIRALEQETSVNALLRDYLTAFADEKEAQVKALEDILEIAASEKASSGGRRWTRDELYDR